MNTLTFESALTDTFSTVRATSFEEKKDFLSEAKVNALLDAILDFKKMLQGKTTKIQALNSKFEKLTWYNHEAYDNENLLKLNDLIASIKDLHSTYIKMYVQLNYIRSKGIAKTDISEFKSAIDDMKDCYRDLESVFFFLPEVPDFEETTKQLSLL